MTAQRIMICVAVFFFLVSIAAADTLTLGAGAGYKRMLEGVIKGYEQKTGHKVDQVYGHMGQIVMQAKASGSIGIIVGELSFLKSSGLEFAEFKDLGQGVLVLAYGKNVKLTSAEDLSKPEIQKIAIPDARQAIYGKAAFEFLQNSSLYEKIQNKIITVATVPQVSSYLMSKDAEAGFINITDAIYIKDKIGGWVEVEKTGYSPIHLVIGSLKGFENKPEIKQFLDFMTTDRETKDILKNAGIR
ncbi:MAG: molybdate ABC transporter substrate-binding protein [Pseudomonadota bacterium]